MPSYLLPATLRLSSELVGHTQPRGVINALHRMASWRGINVLGAWRSAHVRGRASKTRPNSRCQVGVIPSLRPRPWSLGSRWN